MEDLPLLIHFVCIVPLLLLTTLLSHYTGKETEALGFPGGSAAKNPPAVQATAGFPSLGREDTEEDMATHSSTLAWRIPWTEEPGGLQSMGSQESQTGLGN